MDTALIVTGSGLITALGWGLGDFLGAKSSKDIGAIVTGTISSVYGTIGFLIFYAIFLHSHHALTLESFIYAVMSGTFLSFGLLTFYTGLDIGPVSLVSPVASVYPLVTALIAVLAFHSHLTPKEIAGIIFIVLGVTLISGLLERTGKKRKITKGIKFGLFAVVLWGIGYASLGQAIKLAGWQTAGLIDFVTSSIVLVVILLIFKKYKKVSDKNVKLAINSKTVILIAIIQSIGFVVFCYGVSRSTANGGAVITAISSCYPILTIFLALRHFKEKVSPLALFGALVGIFGVILLSL